MSIRLVYITGIISVVSIALVMLTCRCPVIRFPGLLKSKAFAALNRYHCLSWGIFMLSLVLHVLAVFGVL